eukprot:gene5949-11302_t
MAAHMVNDIGVHSRFSVLANDDSDESEEEVSKKNDEDAKKKAKNAKKRARKKKKAALATAENNELRNLAFGGKPKHGQQGKSITVTHQIEEKPPVQAQENSSEWEERDEQEALRVSLEEEKQRLVEKSVETISTKKKKDHSVKLSLDEFQEQVERTGNSSDKKGFNEVPDLSKNNVENLPKKHKKKKEKIHTAKPKVGILNGAEDTKKISNIQTAPALDPASVQQWMNEVEKRDIENSLLRKSIDELREELAEVKKRNKQLCFILGQGEMRDKSEILQQIETLTNIKDELSSELSEMHSLLEQERSRVSILKLELAKSQVGRAKKPSFSENGHR